MFSDIYCHPEKYALWTVGEIEWTEPCYSFDLTVVWQDTNTGSLYYADDSGCSCPSPFEDTDRDDLVLIDRPQVLIDHVNDRIAQMKGSYYSGDEINRAIGESGQLIQKVRKALS